MSPTINADRLADVRRIAAKLERLPENTLKYVVGYVEGAADISEQYRTPVGERREGT